MKKIFLATGIAAPSLYGFTVVLGGWLSQDYDHTIQAISELTALGAPLRLPLNLLFSLSLILAAVFALSAFHYVRQFNSKLLRTGTGILLAISVLSMLWAFFPMDPRGAETSVKGVIHLALAGIVSPLTIVCPILVGLGFRKVEKFKVYALYSMVSGVLIMITGIMAVVSTQYDAAYLGIYERLTIGSYQQWMAVSALVFIRVGMINNITSSLHTHSTKYTPKM